MPAITTRETFRDKTALLKRKVWKTLTITNGDTLKTGFKEVFAVHVSEPNHLSWTDAAGTLTFVTSENVVGPVIIEGRG
jgi:hypothetical protein